MTNSQHRRVGFTLVELLVVIAIIGILVALLMPAVQMARNSANRVTCSNHFKQVGLALHNYHLETNSFPAGGQGCTYGYYGNSWWVFVLPGLEESSLYDRYDKTGAETRRQYSSSGYIVYPHDWAANGHNYSVLNGKVLPVLKCPSSPIPPLHEFSSGTTSYSLFNSDYVAISGSSRHSSQFDMRFSYYSVGIVSAGGILVPNSWVRISGVTDGTSKTMIVGEQSDYCYSADGSPAYCRSSCFAGFSMGLAQSFPGGDNRAWNLATIRYRIGKDASLMNSHGCAANSPLQSAHPGGVNVLMADGSVRFLSEDTAISILQNMADRDDGAEFADPEA